MVGVRDMGHGGGEGHGLASAEKCFLSNAPMPVKRVDGSPQLGLPSESLIKAESFWTLLRCAVLGVENLYFCSVFGSFALNIFVLPRSLGGGFPRTRNLHPQHHGSPCCHDLSLFFADTSGVLLFQSMLEFACWGFGWGQVQ